VAASKGGATHASHLPTLSPQSYVSSRAQSRAFAFPPQFGGRGTQRGICFCHSPLTPPARLKHSPRHLLHQRPPLHPENLPVAGSNGFTLISAALRHIQNQKPPPPINPPAAPGTSAKSSASTWCCSFSPLKPSLGWHSSRFHRWQSSSAACSSSQAA
jgi:hypothetical protein